MSIPLEPNAMVSQTADIWSEKDRASLAKLLDKGIALLNVELTESQKQKLLGFVELLAKWSAVYNLTAIRDPQQMLIQHILDSLALVPHLSKLKPSALLDVGTGGGLPGVVLAIALPSWQITLNDIVRKKTAFLTQVKAILQLQNVAVATARVEALQSRIGKEKQFDVVVSRAFAKLSDFIAMASYLVAPGGALWAMKGTQPDAEIAALPNGAQVARILELDVPFLDAKRCLVQITVKPAQDLSKRSSAGGGRSAGTGAYINVREDSEHRPTLDHGLLGRS